MSHKIPSGEEVLSSALMATEKAWLVENMVAEFDTAMDGKNDWQLVCQNSKPAFEIKHQTEKLERRIADVEDYIGKRLVVSVVALNLEEDGITPVTGEPVTGEIMDWDAKAATFELSTAEGNCVIGYAVPTPVPERFAEQGQTYFGHTSLIAMTVLQENAYSDGRDLALLARASRHSPDFS